MPVAPDFPADRPWLRAVLAMTLDGMVRGADGGSRSISSAADQRWFAALRRQPDVLLVGAGTIRAEDYRPSRRVVAIVSESLDLPASLRMLAERTSQHPRPLVLTTDQAAERAPDHLRVLTDVLPCGDTAVDLRAVRAILIDRGLTRIQCEGGPRLLSGVIAAGLLDELLLSVTPYLHGGDPDSHLVTHDGGLDPALQSSLRLVDVHQEEGTAFLRLLRRDDPGSH